MFYKASRFHLFFRQILDFYSKISLVFMRRRCFFATAITLSLEALLKAVILAGGFGTRLSEETTYQPKPMVTIGDRPIIWHIMKIFEHHGISEFIICCGYKGYILKEYFANYYLHNSDFTIDLADASIDIISRKVRDGK